MSTASHLSASEAFVHGCRLVFVDALDWSDSNEKTSSTTSKRGSKANVLIDAAIKSVEARFGKNSPFAKTEARVAHGKVEDGEDDDDDDHDDATTHLPFNMEAEIEIDAISHEKVSLRALCEAKLKQLCATTASSTDSTANASSSSTTTPAYAQSDDEYFALGEFRIARGDFNRSPDAGSADEALFTLRAPTTRHNALSLMRALQLPRPILVEGTPGCGKTSLVVTLARLANHRVVRINLSEQTDMMDLLGSELPDEDAAEAGRFTWRDGPLLQALRRGDWVLLTRADSDLG